MGPMRQQRTTELSSSFHEFQISCHGSLPTNYEHGEGDEIDSLDLWGSALVGGRLHVADRQAAHRALSVSQSQTKRAMVRDICDVGRMSSEVHVRRSG